MSPDAIVALLSANLDAWAEIGCADNFNVITVTRKDGSTVECRSEEELKRALEGGKPI